MQFCDKHWIALQEAIDNSGLNELKLVGTSALDATIRMIQGHGDISGYNPLMSAGSHIAQHALVFCGPDLLINKLCPICETENVLTDHVLECDNPVCSTRTRLEGLKYWIALAIDYELGFARENKLIPNTQ